MLTPRAPLVDSALEDAGDQVAVGGDMIVVGMANGRRSGSPKQRVAHLGKVGIGAIEAIVDAPGDRVARFVAAKILIVLAHLQKTGSGQLAHGRQQNIDGARRLIDEKGDGPGHRPQRIDCDVGEVGDLLEAVGASQQSQHLPGGRRQVQRFHETLGIGRQWLGPRSLLGGAVERSHEGCAMGDPRFLELCWLECHIAADHLDDRSWNRQVEGVGALVQPQQQSAGGADCDIGATEHAGQVARDEPALDIGDRHIVALLSRRKLKDEGKDRKQDRLH